MSKLARWIVWPDADWTITVEVFTSKGQEHAINVARWVCKAPSAALFHAVTVGVRDSVNLHGGDCPRRRIKKAPAIRSRRVGEASDD